MSPYVPETTFHCLMQNKEAMESVHLLLGIHSLRQMIRYQSCLLVYMYMQEH